MKRLLTLSLCLICLAFALPAPAEETGAIPLGLDNYSRYFSWKANNWENRKDESCSVGCTLDFVRNSEFPQAVEEDIVFFCKPEDEISFLYSSGVTGYEHPYDIERGLNWVWYSSMELFRKNYETEEEYLTAVEEEKAKVADQAAYFTEHPSLATVQGRLIVSKAVADEINQADYEAALAQMEQTDDPAVFKQVYWTMERLATLDYADSAVLLSGLQPRMEELLAEESARDRKQAEEVRKAQRRALEEAEQRERKKIVMAQKEQQKQEELAAAQALLETDSLESWQKAKALLKPYVAGDQEVRQLYDSTFIPTVDFITPFTGDVAAYGVVDSTEKYVAWGLLKGDGTILTEAKYAELGNTFSTPSSPNGNWWHLSSKPDILIEGQGLIRFGQFPVYQDRSTGLATCKKYGFINLEGKEVIPPIFDYANHFYSEYTTVLYEGQWQVIDTKGETITKLPEHGQYGAVSEGLIMFADKKKDKITTGFTNLQGETVFTIKDPVSELSRFQNGRAVLLYLQSSGASYKYNTRLIDTQGKVLISGASRIYPLSNGNYLATYYNKSNAFAAYPCAIFNRDGKAVKKKGFTAQGYKSNQIQCFDSWGSGYIFLRTTKRAKLFSIFLMLDSELEPVTLNGKKEIDLGNWSYVSQTKRVGIEVESKAGYTLFGIEDHQLKKLTDITYKDVGIGTYGNYISVRTHGDLWRILDLNGNNMLK